jgi:transcriptional regulator with XRE-family HTH domain
MTSFSDWVDDTALAIDGIDKDADMARLFGVLPSTVARWRTAAGPPDRDTLRKISEGLGVPMIVVLQRAGFLTESEASVREVEVPRRLTNSELVAEIDARLRLLDGGQAGGGGLDRAHAANRATAASVKGLKVEGQGG